MKHKLVNLINDLGQGLNELVFDFEIDGVKFNSIEWLPEEDIILLHIFEDEEIDYHCDFGEINIDKQIEIYEIVLKLKTI